MRLDAVGFVAPSKCVTNDDLMELIREASRQTPAEELSRIMRKVELLLRRSGAQSRQWLGPHERPLDLVKTSVEMTLDATRIGRETIDLLIYAGIDRGFVEPANAYFVAKTLGMGTVECFDIVDACNGWSRALQVVQHAFLSGTYKTALVINAEFPMQPGGAVFPAGFEVNSEQELAWLFAGYTLGEGATATLVSADGSPPWTFRSASRPCYADLCTVPLPGYERYSDPSPRLAPNGDSRFSSFAKDLFAIAADEVSALFTSLDIPVDAIRLIVPHAATQKLWDERADALGVRHLLHNVYARYGNLGSASIPAGLATAIAECRLERGDLVVTCSASAGMAFTVASFFY